MAGPENFRPRLQENLIPLPYISLHIWVLLVMKHRLPSCTMCITSRDYYKRSPKPQQPPPLLRFLHPCHSPLRLTNGPPQDRHLADPNRHRNGTDKNVTRPPPDHLRTTCGPSADHYRPPPPAPATANICISQQNQTTAECAGLAGEKSISQTSRVMTAFTRCGVSLSRNYAVNRFVCWTGKLAALSKKV